MLERDIEHYLTTEARKRGGLAFKFVSPGACGVPDRIVIAPGGAVWFVELKTETGRLSPLQTRHLELLRNVGANATVVYGMDGVRQFLREAFGDAL